MQHSPIPPSDAVADSDAPITLSQFVHVLRAYRYAILVALTAVVVGYAIVAIIVYLAMPSQRLTELSFRLNFQGAANGEYPNGLKFSTTDVTSAPVLLKVYQANHIDRYVSLDDFSRAIFVMDTNEAYQKLASEYAVRLADPKLSPIDRDRIEKEFDAKRDSLSKDEYSIDWLGAKETARVPNVLVRKVLADILAEWARYAAVEQRMLQYRVSVLSPEVIDRRVGGATNLVVDIQVLRSQLQRVLDNVDEISHLPGAEMVRTADHMSLAEIRMHVDEIIRFRLEPLVPLARNSGLVGDQATTIEFLQTQLAHDQRQLQAQQERVNAIRDSLLLYANASSSRPDAQVATANGGAASAAARPAVTPDVAGVAPQLSDSFLDRLVTMMGKSADTKYRQDRVDDLRRASIGLVPLQLAVAYDQQMLDEVRAASGKTGGATTASVAAELESMRGEARRLISRMNEIYVGVSRNLNPTTELYSVTAPPVSRVERSVRPERLLLYGALTLLFALPIIIGACVIHSRVQDGAADDALVPVHETA